MIMNIVMVLIGMIGMYFIVASVGIIISISIGLIDVEEEMDDVVDIYDMYEPATMGRTIGVTFMIFVKLTKKIVLAPINFMRGLK